MGALLSTTTTKTGDYGLGPIPTHQAQALRDGAYDFCLRPRPIATRFTGPTPYRRPRQETDGHVIAGLAEESEKVPFCHVCSAGAFCVVCAASACVFAIPRTPQSDVA